MDLWAGRQRTLERDAEGYWRVAAVTAEWWDELNKLCTALNFAEAYVPIQAKNGQLIPFRVNASQEVIVQQIADSFRRGVNAEILAPKGRQQGVSTLSEVLCFSYAQTVPGFRGIVVANKGQNADVIFGIMRTAHDNCEPSMRLGVRSARDGHYRYDGGSSIQLMKISSGEGTGHGATANMIHASEAAVWGEAVAGPGKIFDGLRQAAYDERGLIVIIESTPPEAPDVFFEPAVRAVLNGEPSAHQLCFLPPYLEPGYRVSEERYYRETGQQFTSLNQEEQNLQAEILAQPVSWHAWPVELPTEFWLWRRLKIRGAMDKESVDRYYPLTVEMAFATRGERLFTAEALAKLKISEPEWKGKILVGALQDADPGWCVSIWEHPKPRATYVVSADGTEYRSEKSDPCAAYVAEITPGLTRVVAALHGRMEPAALGEQLRELSDYYNEAALIPEANRGFEAVRYLTEHCPERLYWTSRTRAGFYTSAANRKPLLGRLRSAVQDGTFQCPDAGFVSEARTMIPVRGKWQASGKAHDDRVIAAALLLEFAEPAPPPEPPEKAVLEALGRRRV